MGNSLTFSQPYIVDEYYSDDELNYDSGTESNEDASPPVQASANQVNCAGENHKPNSETNDPDTTGPTFGIPPGETTPDGQMTGVPGLAAVKGDQNFIDDVITSSHLDPILSSPVNNTNPETILQSSCSPGGGGHAAATTPGLLENGQVSPGKQNGHDKLDEAELDAEQRRALERLDSDLSTFEAVEQSLLEASKEFRDSIDRDGEQNGLSSGSSEKNPNGSSSHTGSAIPRLQQSSSCHTRLDNGHQPDLDLSPEGDPLEERMTSSASSQLCSSAPCNVEDQPPPSPSTHQLIHSFSLEEADVSGTSPTGNIKRGVSPRRHSGIPVRQNSFSGSSTLNAAAYILYKGDSESETVERPGRGSGLVRGVSVSSDRDTDGDDVTISDLTGRARRSKKRSGIPSAWMARSKGEASPRSARSGSPMGSELDTSYPPMDRKIFDIRRWYCMSRPQYKTSCGVSSLVSCWNFLFSSLGHGSLKPLTQETAMSILGFPEPYDDIKFGVFTGNLALMRWFQELNTNFRVKGKCFFLYKPVGKNRTPGVTPGMALTSLKRGLCDPSMTFIYHCQNHYFCPIGFDESALRPQESYKNVADDKRDAWILIGETSKKFPALHCKNWRDICTDLNSKSPEFYDIRREWKGIRRTKTAKSAGNLHCIMAFQKVSGSFCSPSGSLRPSRLPVSPGSQTSRHPVPEAVCECEEPGPVLEEEELGLEDLDSSQDEKDIEEEEEEEGEDGTEIIDDEEGEFDGHSEEGSVTRV